MCGITGFVSRENFRSEAESERILGSMCHAILHRGPDEQGVTVNGRVGLGMRRLSIIDLKTGQQPIFNHDNSLAIVFNGEIYNYLDLKKELESLGHRFKTNSDTETILLAYQEYGPASVKKLRGMFAFAIWDFRDQSLFIARDRIGKKPLFHTFAEDGSFVFGSEVKSILEYPGIDRTMSLSSFESYLTFGYVPEDRCIFKHFKKLPPGHFLRFDRDLNIEVKQYWDPDDDKSDIYVGKSEAELIGELRERIRDAVKVRMISEVPLGAFLSGGVDSSTVVAMMSELSSTPVKTFSIGFNEDSYSELKYARMAAERYGTEHHEFIVTPDLTDIVDDIAWYFDEPFADPSSLPTFMVSKLAREHVTVALSGDGGDELFAGYTRYADSIRRSPFAYIPRSIRGVLPKIANLLPHSAPGKNYLYYISLDLMDQYIDLVSHFNAIKRKEIFPDDMLELLTNEVRPEDAFSRMLDGRADKPFLENMLYLDMKTYLPSDIMTKVDRMTMANSLEARAPLLDMRVVELAANIPLNLKLKGTETKYILKKAMEGLVSNDILYREKQGFGVPIEEWINDQLSARIRDTILDGHALKNGFIKRPYIDVLLNEHSTGRRDHSYSLWILFMFELWYAKYQN